MNCFLSASSWRDSSSCCNSIVWFCASFSKVIICIKLLFYFQALDVLLDLSASSYEQSRNSRYFNNPMNYKEDNACAAERNDNVSNVLCITWTSLICFIFIESFCWFPCLKFISLSSFFCLAVVTKDTWAVRYLFRVFFQIMLKNKKKKWKSCIIEIYFRIHGGWHVWFKKKLIFSWALLW